MATSQNGGVSATPQAPSLPAVRVLDDQSYPLISHDELPFVDPNNEVMRGITWSPPTGYFDGLRYGLNCALALLRVAPEGHRSRADEVEYAGDELLDQQTKTVLPHSMQNGAYYARWSFWQTILHFTMVRATLANIEAYRVKTERDYLSVEVSALRHQVRKLKGDKRKGSRRRKAVRS